MKTKWLPLLALLLCLFSLAALAEAGPLTPAENIEELQIEEPAVTVIPASTVLSGLRTQLTFFSTAASGAPDIQVSVDGVECDPYSTPTATAATYYVYGEWEQGQSFSLLINAEDYADCTIQVSYLYSNVYTVIASGTVGTGFQVTIPESGLSNVTKNLYAKIIGSESNVVYTCTLKLWNPATLTINGIAQKIRCSAWNFNSYGNYNINAYDLTAGMSFTIGDSFTVDLGYSRYDGYDFKLYLSTDETGDGSSGTWIVGYGKVGTPLTITLPDATDDGVGLVVDIVDGDKTLFKFQLYNAKIIVARSDGHLSSAEKIQQLVAECEAACTTDAEKAVWVHDWLLLNAAYDDTYTYYGSCGVLLYGTGVCDSYSRAYTLLMRAMGIDSQRVISSGMNHSWNAVKLDGLWYMVDCTWDDQAGGISHAYCLVNDDLMQNDHTYFKGEWNSDGVTYPVYCGSLNLNYYVKGEPSALIALSEDLYAAQLTKWHSSAERELSRQAGSKANTGFVQGKVWIEIDGDVFYYATDFDSKTRPILDESTDCWKCYILAWLMDNSTFQVNGFTRTVHALYSRPLASYGPGTFRLSCSNGVVATVFATLPAGLTVISAEAFMNDSSLLEITVPATVTCIGSKAFANCTNLSVIKLLNKDNVEIADDAFENCSKYSDGTSAVTLQIAEGNTAAVAFAEEHGLQWSWLDADE